MEIKFIHNECYLLLLDFVLSSIFKITNGKKMPAVHIFIPLFF